MLGVFYCVLLLIVGGFAFAGVGGGREDIGDIQHLLFSEDKLFFCSKSWKNFGFISSKNGEIMTQYQLQTDEAIISIDKEKNSIVLRHGRTQAFLLEMQSLHVQQLNIQITFLHQRIRDVQERDNVFYVLTEKDIRAYLSSDFPKDQSLNYIVTSARKAETFKKMFLKPGEKRQNIILVLAKDDQVCVRTFLKTKRGEDRCFFRTTYEITGVEQISGHILIQTDLVNYVIDSSMQTVSSFKGIISQIGQDFVLLQDQFKTYVLQQKLFIDGFKVPGSTKDQQFWIKQQEEELCIFKNGEKISKINSQIPTKVWGFLQTDKFNLVLQVPKLGLMKYQILLDDNQQFERVQLKWNQLPEQNEVQLQSQQL